MAGLFLLGCNAVLAPNILYLAPESFGADISQSVTGLEMAAMYVGMLGLPALFGLLTRFFPSARSRCICCWSFWRFCGPRRHCTEGCAG